MLVVCPICAARLVQRRDEKVRRHRYFSIEASAAALPDPVCPGSGKAPRSDQAAPKVADDGQ